MGRLSQLYWFLNEKELPLKRDRDFTCTALDVEAKWVKDLRKERLKELRELEKLRQIFSSILCLCVEGREVTARENLLDAIQGEAGRGLKLGTDDKKNGEAAS